MAGSTPEVQPCQTCGVAEERRFTCVQCNNLAFCETCWPKWVLHAPGAVGWNGKPHEKADPAVVHTLRQILEPTRTEEEHAFELLEDEDTTWFGFGRDTSGQSMFYDYGRFSAIMSELVANGTPEIYPQLVSVIGETGAGKSTLIKMLIDRQASGSDGGSRYYSPVTSSNQDRTATTGDVHIYADPSSAFSTNPLLFVDCEGLNGGEAVPRQLRHHQTQDPRSPSSRPSPAAAPPPYQPTVSGEGAAQGSSRYVQSRHTSKRPIAWAKTPQTCKREFAVSHLYPRVLYTFSDAVVFVLRNPRAFESTVLGRLIRWGAQSIDASLNQPALPHAVVVLNATEPGVDQAEWDVGSATEMLLSDVAGAVGREPALRGYVGEWARRGKKITTTAELLACYYASVSVVRVPHKGPGSYMRMDEQAGKLMALVRDRCAASHAAKRRLRMLATAERLQIYLQAAYDHFTKSLDAPFDFVREALRKFPIARNFQGNVLSLALAIRDNSTHESLREDARRIFLAMAPMIASCIMLDAVRQNLLGTATRLLDDKYAKPCAAALQSFADIYWPCSFWNTALGDAGRCCNVRSGHNPKGHQNAQGKVIGNGSYQSTLDPESFQPEWVSQIRRSLEAIEASASKLGQALPARTELSRAALLHRERLNEFYRAVGGAPAFASHSACLSCLRELPECALPCGHVLCLPCMELYGTRTSRTCVEISRCPLHVADVIAEPPWVVVVKPARAGVRVLCLDGGGVRGITQLRVLREVERVLGPGLPIQLFFDFMVGTNTGGIIAIGLGVKRWTVEATTEKFKDICKEAFTPREMQKVPLIGALSKMYHGSVFKTQPLEKVLKRYFSETPFFGGSRSRHNLNTSVKVAVTASTVFQSVIFANYNRPDPAGKATPYRFIRSDVADKELRVWEVARATSAAPPFFKAFVAPETNSEYVDGSKSHGCPTKVAHSEMRSIWPDVADLPPDIMLSIGSGRVEGEQSAPDSAARPSSRSSRSIASTDISSISGPRKTTVTKSATMPVASGQIVRSGRGGVGNYKRVDSAPTNASDNAGLVQTGIFVRDPKTPLLLSLAPRPSTQEKAQAREQVSGRSDALYDLWKCDQAWEEFVSGKRESHDRRYTRICPELLASQIPRFEDAQRMEELERDVERALQQDTLAGSIAMVAHQLVASTFFFETEYGSIRQTPSGYACTGTIFCRFRQSSPELMALGSFLRSCCNGNFRPYFLIEDDIDSDTRRKRQIILSEAFIVGVETGGCFDIEPLSITTAAEKPETAANISLSLQMAPYSSGASTTGAALPISGFPRRLVSEEDGNKAAKADITVPSTSVDRLSVLVGSEQRREGGQASSDRVSGMSTSPSSLSADVSPVTTYTIASRSSTGSTSFSGVGLEKPRRMGEGSIAELPDHGSQAAELPSN